MKKRILFSLVSLTAVLCMATMVSAGSVTWNALTDPSKVNAHPGDDGLMGTADDVAGGDPNNTAGSFSVDPVEWGTHAEDCAANDPGPDDVAYGTGTITWCMGSPSAGQVEWTNVDLDFTAIPGYFNIPYSYGLIAPPGGDDVGSPCGTGTVTSTIDLVLTQLGFPSFEFPDQTSVSHVYAVGDPNPAAVTCPKVDGGNATWSTSDLLAIEALLPGSATHYMVSCGAVSITTEPPPCFDSPYTAGNAWVFWTDGAVTTCDGCGGGSGCMAGTAENVE
jgi:hypothetical protein